MVFRICFVNVVYGPIKVENHWFKCDNATKTGGDTYLGVDPEMLLIKGPDPSDACEPPTHIDG